MRKKERKAEEGIFILEETNYLSFAITDNNDIYQFAVNHVYDNGYIYYHGAKEGRKSQLVKRNKKTYINFLAIMELGLSPQKGCSSTSYFKSVMGNGYASVVTAYKEKLHIINLLMFKFFNKDDFNFPEEKLCNMDIIKVKIDSISVKANLPISKSSIFKRVPTLETERLILREIELSDAESMFDFTSDEETMKYMGVDIHYNIDDTIHYIKGIIHNNQTDREANWSIILKETNEMVGFCSLLQSDCTNKFGEIGYAINKRFRGNGYAPEAIKMMVDFGFNQVGLNRVEAFHLLQNPPSGIVLEKAGLKYEATLKGRYLHKKQYKDIRLYAITKSNN